MWSNLLRFLKLRRRVDVAYALLILAVKCAQNQNIDYGFYFLNVYESVIQDNSYRNLNLFEEGDFRFDFVENAFFGLREVWLSPRSNLRFDVFSSF